jgi:hypothetical protein
VRSKPHVSIAASCIGFLFLTTALWAQEGAVSRHVGMVQDWSDRNIVFTLDGLARHPELLYTEPRIMHKLMQRYQTPGSAISRSEGGSAATAPDHRDWSVALGRNHVAPNMYPAKYSFDPSLPPDCKNDFVVFGIDTGGTTKGQANLVGVNNLYAGTNGICGGAPTVLFAYNVTTGAGGKVTTSPVLSEDGTQIAFVESRGSSSIFHVVTWGANGANQGTIGNAVVPVAMTSLTYSSTAATTTSAPWVDYTDHVAYVGDDSGIVYQITNVFNGTPALGGAPWPVTVSSGFRMSPPVLDREISTLLVGSRNGNLYEVDTNTGNLTALVVGAHGHTNPGVLAAPLIDVTNGTAFVVSANDGTSAVIVQADISTTLQLAKARIGLGASTHTVLSIGQPALDNNYYNNASTGTIYACGTGSADTTPWLYSFGFSGTTLNTTATSSKQLLTSTAATCSNFTEFYNPNIGGGTDFFFFGLTQDCTGAGTAGGCVAALTSSTLLTATVAGGPSGIVVDNYSTDTQASSIYLTGEAVNSAFKFTQNGLR